VVDADILTGPLLTETVDEIPLLTESVDEVPLLPPANWLPFASTVLL